jgi:hypothetical protein
MTREDEEAMLEVRIALFLMVAIVGLLLFFTLAGIPS